MLSLHPGAAVGPVKELEEEWPTLACADVRLNIREVDELKECLEAAAHPCCGAMHSDRFSGMLR
jgi:hypothetical protein